MVERAKNGELIESFGAGTAVVISSIKNIEYDGVNYPVPYDKKLNFGAIAFKIRANLLGIQEGRIEDPFDWVRRIK